LLVSGWLALVGLLMISKLRTLSPKAIKIPRRLIALVLCATAIVIGLVFADPWIFLVVLGAAYLATVLHALIRARGALFG
jgi:CDP-diacylglycerol--serine O-phosphatidyltransferase